MNNTVKITYTFPDGAGGTFTDTDQIHIEHLQAEVQQIIDKAVLNQTNSIIEILRTDAYLLVEASKIISDCEFKIDDGSRVIHTNYIHYYRDALINGFISLIKGKKK